MRDQAPLATFRYALQELNRLHLAYAHVITSTPDDLRHGAVAVSLMALRHEFQGPFVVANGFTRATATQALVENVADAVAFGRLFIANPDLPGRFRVKGPLNTPDEGTFYGGNAIGYTDYPALGTELAHAFGPDGSRPS